MEVIVIMVKTSLLVRITLVNISVVVFNVCILFSANVYILIDYFRNRFDNRLQSILLYMYLYDICVCNCYHPQTLFN